MSGGHFDYVQFRIDDTIEALEQLSKSTEYSEECVRRFNIALHNLEIANKQLHNIDWFVSGDIGEEAFVERWEE